MAAKGDSLIVGGYFNHVGKFTGCGAMVTAASDEPGACTPSMCHSILFEKGLYPAIIYIPVALLY